MPVSCSYTNKFNYMSKKTLKSAYVDLNDLNYDKTNFKRPAKPQIPLSLNPEFNDSKSFCFEEEYSRPSGIGRQTHISLSGSKLKDRSVTAGRLGGRLKWIALGLTRPIWAKRTEVTGKTKSG